MSTRIARPTDNDRCIFMAQHSIVGELSSPPDCTGRTLRFVWLLSAYAIVGGVITLIGWALDLPRLTDWRGDGISMFVNAAICSALSGVSLILIASSGPAWRRTAARIAAIVVAILGGLTLIQHLTGVNFGIDVLVLKRGWGQRAAMATMRMGPPASTSFLFLGIALLLATYGSKARRLASVLAMLPVAIASLSLTGFLFGADQLFGIARYTGIAWQTSTILAALGIAAMVAISEYGAAAALGREDAGGALLRRMLVPAVVIPLILGWINVAGRNAGMYDSEFGIALRSLIEMVLLISLVWWAAESIRRLEGSAAESHGKLAAIVENTDDAVVSKSLDGTILSWNTGAERLLGYSAREAVGKNILMIIPQDRADEEATILDRLRRGERMEHFETVRVRKDGKIINVSLTVSPVRNSSGKIIGALKIARDISEQKRSEQALRRSEAELQTLANTIPQLAWMAHPDGNIFWYNQRWFEYTGTNLDKMRGWGWQSAHDPERLPAVVERWKHSLETGEPFEMEFPLRGADGQFRWFLTRVTPFRDEEGHIIRWFGTNTDIDDAKHLERALRDQAQTLELLNETGTVVGSTLELQSLTQSVTDIATELSGAKFGAFFYNTTDENGDAYLLYTLSGAPRTAFENLGSPRTTPLFARTFRGEGPVRSDDILQDSLYGQMAPHHGMPVGHLPVRSYLAVPVVLRDGNVVGGMFFGHPEVGVFSSQTERLICGIAAQAGLAMENARLYENLKHAAGEREQLLAAERAARSDAERANLMKDEFLATLSHELRTPLSAILGWSQLLAICGLPETEVKEGLASIERNARAQTQLIEDLLDMNRIVSGKLRLDVQSTDLAKVVEATIDSARPSADGKQIQLRKIIDPLAGPVCGDPNRLQQVFWNLLTNAIKFTPKGGKVEVLLQRVNSQLEVTVRDTGIGIKPEVLPYVFERFRQADSSTTRLFGGLGLGLSIVKSLIEMHGGTVSVDSPGENQGAQFTVSLPLAPIRCGDERDHPKSSNPAGSDLGWLSLTGVRILVIDDEPDTRVLLKRVLGQCDADVLTAATGQEGLELVRSQNPDVIVSDIGMPGMDGYEFIRNVRRLQPSEACKIPAIALTAFARSEDRTRAMLAGYQVHLAKPIEPRELTASVANLVRRNRE